MKIFLFTWVSFSLICGCSKTASDNHTAFIKYTIPAGAHYSDRNDFKFINISEMSFTVKFDSTAIYQTIDPANQADINKLYGFSEGNNHQYNSARIGWAWYAGSLRLYGYVYNESVRHFKEITTINIGSEISCSIKLMGNNYLFTVNGVTDTLPRANATATTTGYQLYPYFGGDETAPHDIYILIR